MELIKFKTLIEESQKTRFSYGISEPFSWRGSYDEVAFAVLATPMDKDEFLRRINLAFTEIFYGYKGGEYKYKDWTQVHFEESVMDYTDGRYCGDWIAEIEGTKSFNTQEERLANLLVNS